ncbi:hypothetical protein CYCD_13480 [Tenuifilaceae bacterium CYCD]|nr:hypothetical protein CYCD_13480 [Tenuifilaceae bacterium CYCD]
MKRWTTKNGYEIYQVLTGRCNSYLVKFGGVVILVDTGKTAAYKKLTSNIESLKLSANTQKILVLTHSHFDHCQNAWALSNHYNYKVWVSKDEAEFAKQGYTPLPKGTYSISKLISAVGEKCFSFRLGYRPFVPDILVDDEMALSNLGLNIKIFTTPGHSVGSISVIVDDEIALVGDALFGVFPNSIFPPFADDTQIMVDSWKKLSQTNCRLFLPAHGNAISRNLLLKEYHKYSN